MNAPSKLLLFDIDGTMLKAPSGQVLIETIAEQLGRPIDNHHEIYLGGTDLTVVPELLERNNIQVEDVDAFTQIVLQDYDQRVTSALEAPGKVRLLEGTKALVEYLNELPQFALGLVTGNTKVGAYAKLTPPGLADYFKFGAFGDDHGNRDLLPPLAVDRANQHHDTEFFKENTWIIGDTQKDIRCAKANGLRCLAVASGWIDADTLQQHEPDAVMHDLSNIEQVLEILNR